MSKIEDFVLKDGVVFFKDEDSANFFWSPYSLENDDFLYDTFGKLLGERYEKDSPEYRLRLEGIMYALTHGAVTKSLEVVLNIMAGAPINLNRTTIVESISDENVVGVVHSGDVRELIDVKGFLLNPNIIIGTKLEPYQPLSRYISIRDEMNCPRWWDLDYIDVLSPLREYRVNEEGERRPLTQEQRRLINEVLKHNCFGIRIPAEYVSAEGSITIPEIRTMVNRIKPAWTFGLTYVVIMAGMFDEENPFSSDNVVNMGASISSIDVEFSEEEDFAIFESFYAEAITVADHTHSHTDPVEITGVDGGGHYHLSETQWDYLVRREGVYHRDLLTVLGVAPGKPAYHFTEADYNYLTGV